MAIGLVPKAQMNYNYTVKMQLYNVDKGAFVFVGFLAKQPLDTEEGCVFDRERSLLEGLLQRLSQVAFVVSLYCLLLSAAVLQRAFSTLRKKRTFAIQGLFLCYKTYTLVQKRIWRDNI